MVPLQTHLSLRDRLLTAWWLRRWRGYLTLRRLLPRGLHGDCLRFATPYGSQFLLDPLAYIDGIVVREGFYESEVLEALRARLHLGSVLWDIGANFGLHAVTLARLVPEATVVAFEPNPAEHARLFRHRAANTPHLITSSLALSDSAGLLPLHLGPEGNSGMTTLAPWSQASYSGTVMVYAATGDSLISSGSLPAPTVIKLDVEGHESAVLRGLARALAHPSCELVVFEDSPDEATPVKQLLRAAGFSLRPLVRNEQSTHALANFVAEKPSLA
jgi:FkbM family methyltransferase